MTLVAACPESEYDNDTLLIRRISRVGPNGLDDKMRQALLIAPPLYVDDLSSIDVSQITLPRMSADYYCYVIFLTREGRVGDFLILADMLPPEPGLEITDKDDRSTSVAVSSSFVSRIGQALRERGHLKPSA